MPMSSPGSAPYYPSPLALSDQRSDAGYPAIIHDGQPVVAADALALLSGVNFASVERVLAGLRALHDYCGTGMDVLVRLENVPLRRVLLENEADADRAANTRALCEAIAHDPKLSWLDGPLRLFERFC